MFDNEDRNFIAIDSAPLEVTLLDAVEKSHQEGCLCTECMGGSSKITDGGPSFIDVPGDVSSTVTLTIGGSINDQLEVIGDRDWFRVTLTAGQTYTFTVSANGANSIADSYLRLHNSVGTQVAFNDDINFPSNPYSRIVFTATTSGTYFVNVGAYDDAEAGDYRVSATMDVADAIPGNSTTTSSLTIDGPTVAGVLDVAGDHDWYRVNLVAGQTYLFRTSATGGAGDPDTYLRLYGTNGTTVLAQNDDGGGGTYSQIRFTATTTGTYYVDVGGYDDSEAGNYVVAASIAPPLPVFTNDQIADQLVNGFWGGAANARHFNVTPGGTITFNLTGLTADGQNLARRAFELWSDATGVNFSEIAGAANITLDDTEDGAYATSTRIGNIIQSSIVNVGLDWLAAYGVGLNTYSFQTYIHEIGHAIGLGHAGPYNGSATYGQDNSYLNDAWATTVMSYFAQDENTYFSGQGFTFQLVVSPIVADILATTSMYGTPNTTRTGNTTYGFNNTSGRDIYNASLYPSVTYTVVDHGGIDTMDYSGFSQNQVINLNPEAFSNIGSRVGNVTIARGSVIENAIGGTGNDTITGNSAANSLWGGNGNDTINADAGDLVLDGGIGTDTLAFSSSGVVGATISGFEALSLSGGASITMTGAQFTGGFTTNATLSGTGALTINLPGGTNIFGIQQLLVAGGSNITVTINGGTGTDAIKGITDAINIINAGDGSDTFRGGLLADILNGGAGNDKMEGGTGADLLTGGTGSDQFRYQHVDGSSAASGIDTITDFEIGVDRINLSLIDTDPVAAGDQGFTFVGTDAFLNNGTAQLRFADSGGNLVVQMDVDGNGTADMEIILQGRAGQTLTSGDFIL